MQQTFHLELKLWWTIYLKKDLISAKKIDVFCVTEIREWRDHDPLVVYSEPPTMREKYAGVSLHLKQ